jgi:hypothetical protein
MASSILLLFSDPDGFFRRDPAEWSGLRVPAAIVLVSGIFAALSGYLVTRLISGLFPAGMEEVSAIAPLMGIAGAGGAFLGSLLMWGVYAAVFFVISMVFMGKGTFTRTLAAVGYGFLPTAIGGLISVILLWYYLPGIQVAPVRDILDIQQATLIITQAPVFRMISILGIIFLIWSASIWTFALRSSRELTLKNAAITVGVPVLIFIILSIVSMGVIS